MSILDIKRAAKRPLMLRLSKSLIAISGLLEMWANADDYLASEEDIRMRLAQLADDVFDLAMFVKGKIGDDEL